MITLATIPDDILNEICSYLSYSRDDLLAISYTSKRLNQAANRYLYRILALEDDRDKQLNSSLRLNPSNAQHIRSYVASNPGRLRRFWSNLLFLHRLDLRINVPQDYRNPFPACLAVKHPSLWCRKLVLKCNGKHEKYLLQRLNTFGGLTKLTLDIPCADPAEPIRHATTQSIVDWIDCPQLEHLTIRGAPDPSSQLRHKFPNLISFDVSLHVMSLHVVSPGLRSHDIFHATDYMWDTFSYMMDNSIHYRVWLLSCKCGGWATWTFSFGSFHSNLRKYAMKMQLDYTPLVHRLAATACFFNKLFGQRHQHYLRLYVDLREYPVCRSRDLQVEKVSEQIQSIIFQEYKPTNLCLKLRSYSKESQHNNDAHIDLVNDDQMDVSLDTDILPDVISTCAPFLSNLRHISFDMKRMCLSSSDPRLTTMKRKFWIGNDEVSVELPLTRQSKRHGKYYTGVWALRKNELLEDTGLQNALGRYFNLVPTLEIVELSISFRLAHRL
jgi:hypothetical protein